MLWIAVVLGVFLFYRFVERKHKVLFFKISGAMVTMAALSFGAVTGWNEFKSRSRKNGVTVKFSSIIPNLPKGEQDRLIGETFKEYSNSFKDLNDTELGYAKAILFPHLFDAGVPLTIANPTGDEMLALLDSAAEGAKGAAGKTKLIELERARAKRYRTERLPGSIEARIKRNPLLIAIIEGLRLNSFSAIQKEYMEQMTDDTLEKLIDFGRMKETANIELGKKANYSSQLSSKLSFEMCNKRDRPLNNVYFDVSGRDSGRSTEKAVLKENYSYPPTHLSSDIIIAPNACSLITWTGAYQFFDQYEVKNVSGNWADD
jgi:hypothetical protein